MYEVYEYEAGRMRSEVCIYRTQDALEAFRVRGAGDYRYCVYRGSDGSLNLHPFLPPYAPGAEQVGEGTAR